MKNCQYLNGETRHLYWTETNNFTVGAEEGTVVNIFIPKITWWKHQAWINVFENCSEMPSLIALWLAMERLKKVLEKLHSNTQEPLPAQRLNRCTNLKVLLNTSLLKMSRAKYSSIKNIQWSLLLYACPFHIYSRRIFHQKLACILVREPPIALVLY